MPTKEDIIAKILQARSDLTREVLEKKIRVKKDAMGKFLTDDGAAYMVANDLEVDLSGESPLKTSMVIKDITVGAGDVTIDGTVVAVYKVRSFHRSNGSEGKVARIVIGDETGDVNVVLWDGKAEVAERRLTKGDKVRVNHSYVRAGLDGKPELNVGQRGSLVILPVSLKPDEEYVAKEVYTKTKEMSEGASVNFIGLVEGISVLSTFRRRDEREGKVVRARLADENGRIMAVFWDEKTDFINKTSRGDYVKILSGYVRRGLTEGLEIHVREGSKVLHIERPEGAKLPTLTLTKIGSLTPKMPSVDVLARVTEVGHIREFIRSSGGKGKVGETFLMDETGSLRLSLWDEKAEILKDISTGDVILVEGGYTREGFNGRIDLNLGKMGTLKINPELTDSEKLPLIQTGLASISELKAGFSASIRGKISENPLIKTVSTRDGNKIKLASLKIQDDAGEIKASFWGELADRFENLPLGTEVTIRNAYVKNGFAGDLELSSRTTTKVEIAQD